jgi:hypothetical protein
MDESIVTGQSREPETKTVTVDLVRMGEDEDSWMFYAESDGEQPIENMSIHKSYYPDPIDWVRVTLEIHPVQK